MLVEFITDYSVNKEGFVASYRTTFGEIDSSLSWSQTCNGLVFNQLFSTIFPAHRNASITIFQVHSKDVEGY